MSVGTSGPYRKRASSKVGDVLRDIDNVNSAVELPFLGRWYTRILWRYLAITVSLAYAKYHTPTGTPSEPMLLGVA